jgi:hypothetical protein
MAVYVVIETQFGPLIPFFHFRPELSGVGPSHWYILGSPSSPEAMIMIIENSFSGVFTCQ